MILHRLLRLHSADLLNSHWDSGRFVTTCLGCDREMVKRPGGEWLVAPRSKKGSGRNTPGSAA